MSLFHGLVISVVSLLMLLLVLICLEKTLDNLLVYELEICRYLFNSFLDYCLQISKFLVLLYRFCSIFIKNFLCNKTFSVANGPLTFLFLQLFRKRFTQLIILSVLRKVNLFNNVLIGFCKSSVVASNCSTFFSLSQIHFR